MINYKLKLKISNYFLPLIFNKLAPNIFEISADSCKIVSIPLKLSLVPSLNKHNQYLVSLLLFKA